MLGEKAEKGHRTNDENCGHLTFRFNVSCKSNVKLRKFVSSHHRIIISFIIPEPASFWCMILKNRRRVRKEPVHWTGIFFIENVSCSWCIVPLATATTPPAPIRHHEEKVPSASHTLPSKIPYICKMWKSRKRAQSIHNQFLFVPRTAALGEWWIPMSSTHS